MELRLELALAELQNLFDVVPERRLVHLAQVLHPDVPGMLRDPLSRWSLTEAEDAQKAYPKSSVARLPGIHAFVSYPVFTPRGGFLGTLCGASKEAIQIQQDILNLMRECARLIGERLSDEALLA
jgi:hypothetical protein